MKEARYYEIKDKKSVQCRLCRHECLILPGRTGICRARKNKDGKLYSLVYGYPVALNVDPVEKKPLFHFMPGTTTYSLGTLGCNFSCANCQNWDISQVKAIEDKVDLMPYYSPEKIVNDALENECPSISYTYNEPTIFTEYALDIMKLAHQNGLKNIWVSNGYMGEDCLKDIIPFLDAINVDLKSIDNNFYLQNCGAKISPVLENLKTLKKNEVHLELTTLVIPTLSDDRDMMIAIANFIASELGDDVPWHLSKFSPAISWKLKKLAPTGDEVIYDAYEIGKNAGLKYVYVGNIPGDQKENTYCPRCYELAIRRLGYDIERYDEAGRCAKCERSLDIID